MSVEPGTELQLADWRRQVSDLYADVRRLAAGDVPAALTIWREERERLYRDHPMSPVPAAERTNFSAKHFEYDPRLRFEVSVRPAGAAPTPATADPPGNPLATPTSSPLATPPPLNAPLGAPPSLPNSGADVLSFRRIG